MNPGDNNPLNNTGAGGASGSTAGSSPLDFTAPTGNSSVNAGLSMADSMAAAQDNLTSAGMAAPDVQTAMGLDQIGASDPMATMAAPDQPLVPAAPVPGSIGSVTSVPPLNSTPEVPDSVTNTAPGVSPNNPFANTPATTIAEGAGGVGSALPTDSAKAAEPVQPYNPFAAQPGSMPTSSTSVPDALQPQSEKFTADADGKKPKNLLTIILGGLAALFAVTTIIFLVLWMQAKDNVGTGNPIVIPPIDETPVEDTLAIMTCSRDDGVGEGIEGLAELQTLNRLLTANFKNGELTSIELANGYGFATPEAAEAMRGYFEAQIASLAELGTQMGIEPITAEFVIDGYTVSERFAASPDKLIGSYLPVFMLNPENMSEPFYLEDAQAAYEGQGFVCQVE